MQTSKKNITKIALISTPWPLYSRPSIQLGALKAYLQTNDPNLQVDAHHIYLNLAESIGYRLYHEISQRTWLAETVYAALLYPQRYEAIERLFNQETRPQSIAKEIGFKKLTTTVKRATSTFINSCNWGDYLLAGFSVSLCQLTSALYFIRRIKQKFPEIIVVIGGSSLSGSTTQSFFEIFAEVDIVINGEGELAFSQLVKSLNKSTSLAATPAIHGVINPKDKQADQAKANFNQMKELSRLPMPDYDDYFSLLKSFKSQSGFFPTLPIETSRGCWWRGTSASAQTTPLTVEHPMGCAFCNLNLQWSGYRTKDPLQVVEEIDQLTTKYKTLSVAIADNVLPRKTSKELFENLKKLKKDLHLFSEIRATTPFQELKVMKEAGLQEVQIGIEALSSSLLKKLRKGTTTIQNLEIMRDCELLNITNISNLILHFPGSSEHDVAETLGNIEFAFPYRPLKAVSFWLGYGSPVWQNPQLFGIRAIYNHPNWSRLFPPEVSRSLQFMIQAYRGDLGFQKKIWQPVKRKIESWQKAYIQMQKEKPQSSILSLRDGRDFLMIRQRRFHRDPINHRLVGTSRSIYLFCFHHRSLRRIRSQFPMFAEDKIIAFLKIMVAKKLMFEENGRYLSLAVPVKSRK